MGFSDISLLCSLLFLMVQCLTKQGKPFSSILWKIIRVQRLWPWSIHTSHGDIWTWLKCKVLVSLNFEQWYDYDQAPITLINTWDTPCQLVCFSAWLYTGVIMGMLASQITSFTIVHLTVYSDADQRKYQSSASLAFVWGIHRRPVNSPHKWPVTRKMFPFDDVIMIW